MINYITLCAVLFAVTLLLYVLLLPLAVFGPVRRTPATTRVIVVSILLNCMAQLYLLLHGYIACTVVFILLNCIEAVIIGIRTELSLKELRMICRTLGPQKEFLNSDISFLNNHGVNNDYYGEDDDDDDEEI